MADGEQSRVITVPERGESARCKLSDADIDAIRNAGKRKAGVLWPPADSEDQPETGDTPAARLSVSHGKDAHVVSAGAVVGFVGLPSGRVLQVESKLGSDIGVFWLLAHALDVARLLPRWPELPTKRDSFLETVLLLLRQEVRALVHAGLRNDYVPTEETMGVVRGRVLPGRTIVETRGLAHRVTCLYDDYTADVFDNQVLRLALRAGAACSAGLRGTLLGTDALLDGEVNYEPMDRGAAADKLKGLMDARHPSRRAYTSAHALAYIVLRLLSHSDHGAATRQPGVLLDMERLFEMALRNMLRDAFGYHAFDDKFRFGDSRPPVVKGMNPDIRLDRLLVDAKYKKDPLNLRNNQLQPPDGDVFQAHTYSYFGQRPCALVYAVGRQTKHVEALAGGLDQSDAPKWPRVGLFCLNIHADGPEAVSILDENKRILIDQLRSFASP